MSKMLSLKIKEDLFKETEEIINAIKIPRNSYINKAINFYNKMQKRNLIKNKLKQESESVASESLAVLSEFENLIENDENIE